jgi:hypothetical protein
MATFTDFLAPDDPPPPYEEATTDEEAAADRPPAARVGQMPVAFNLYYKMSMRLQLMHLGEHKSDPQYAVTFHTGFSGKPNIILHASPDPNAAALATSDDKGISDSKVTLPADGQFLELTVPFKSHREGVHYTFTFEAEVGDLKPQIETFEWRSSRGEEVRVARKHGSGWKLVRIARDVGTDVVECSDRASGATRDGKEVVAVYSSNMRTFTKVCAFQFMGSGATGELGPRFPLLAVMTALRIIKINLDAANQGAAVAAAAS